MYLMIGNSIVNEIKDHAVAEDIVQYAYKFLSSEMFTNPCSYLPHMQQQADIAMALLEGKNEKDGELLHYKDKAVTKNQADIIKRINHPYLLKVKELLLKQIDKMRFKVGE